MDPTTSKGRCDDRGSSRRIPRIPFGFLALASWVAVFNAATLSKGDEPVRAIHDESQFHLPTIKPEHRHARELLMNALRYMAPENRMIDPVSGYPFEGWNQDPAKGLYLRSFTQLTAIGQVLELYANVASGNCDSPSISRDAALAGMGRIMTSLRQDQLDPRLSADRLLGNFLDLATGKRLGPLAVDVERHRLEEAFGKAKADAIWKALVAKNWIKPRKEDQEAEILRSSTFGYEFFDGPLAAFKDDPTRQKVMEILDQRVVMIVFIDNANLSASVAKSIGGLLHPSVKDRPEAVSLRQEMERFLEDQQAGYERLYDSTAGQFYFGQDATKDRYFGWLDLQGKWVTGHVDYLVNEFRGPATFVVARYGIPVNALANLGFKMKRYTMRDGEDRHVLAPWEGSAFQGLGLELSMTELERPSWRKLLKNLVDVEVDFSSRSRLAGFLSESYSGEGVQYTGSVGIPEIAVSPLPRITDAASLYTLGTAYSVSPEQIERFLAENWNVISTLLTDHGPWEGIKNNGRQRIEFQTTAHTLSLILGMLGTGSDHMRRYLESRNQLDRLESIFRTTEGMDLLSPSKEVNVFAWSDEESPLRTSHDASGFHLAADHLGNAGIAFVANKVEAMNLSGGMLTLRYRLTAPVDQVVIALKPDHGGAVPEGLIPTEIFTRLKETHGQSKELAIPLPATPGLTRIKEVVFTFGAEAQARPIDLLIESFSVAPIR